MSPSTPSDVIQCSCTNPAARLRLVCFPYAGAGVWTFKSWVQQLPADVRRDTEIWTINLPGREVDRHAHLLTRIPSILDVITPVFSQTCLDRPFVFFGHSMGALVSFELARRLRDHGFPGPDHLVVSAHRAPQLPDPHPPIHQLPDGEFVAALRTFGGTPDGVLNNADLMDMFLPVLRADFAACERYTYADAEPLGCSITAFGGNEDRRVTREELSGWQHQTVGGFTLRMFPGAHFFFQERAQNLVLYALGLELRHILRRLPRLGLT